MSHWLSDLDHVQTVCRLCAPDLQLDQIPFVGFKVLRDHLAEGHSFRLDRGPLWLVYPCQENTGLDFCAPGGQVVFHLLAAGFWSQ